jgi:hypothetical protein
LQGSPDAVVPDLPDRASPAQRPSRADTSRSFDRLLIVNERHLRGVLAAYLRHVNTAQPHRFLKQLAPAQAETQPPAPIDLNDYQIVRRPLLEGLTSEYQTAP